MDVFVTKFDPLGRRLWTTIVGGPNYDRAYAVEVDAQGFVYVAGRAGSGFPVTSGAFQRAFAGGFAGSFYGNQDGVVFKMSPDGHALVWASYFGADDGAAIRDLAIDAAQNIYVTTQHTLGSSYPAAIQQVFNRGPFPNVAGTRDQVAAKIKGDGSQLLWAIHLGGSGNEAGESSVRVDASGNPVFVTLTASTNIQTTPGAYSRTLKGPSDFYVAKVRPDGSGLIFGTYLGGSGVEAVETHNLALDRQGNVIIAAGTHSADFPMKGAYDNTFNGKGSSGTGAATNYSGDAVIAKLSADGSQLLASTFFGGRYGDQAEGVWVDSAGSIYIAGGTYSDNFPVTGDAFQNRLNGGADGFVAKLSSSLGTLLYSTYIGGKGIDYLRTAAVDSQGTFFVGGETQSPDFPLLNELQAAYLSSTDGVLARLRGNAGSSIAGRVMLGESGIGDITVALSGAESQTTVTDSSGNYTFAELANDGDYSVTASHAVYSFTPPSQTFSHLATNQTADFATQAPVRSISGWITSNGAGVSGIAIKLTGTMTKTAVTDSSGYYSIPDVVEGGSYTVTPVHAGYAFAPPSTTFSNVVADQSADFAATPLGSLGKPAVPVPANNGMNVTLTPVLRWKAATGASSYKVYFGTAPVPPLVGTVATPRFVPGPLATGTKYYWRIEALNASGSASSPTWSFKTKLIPNPPASASPANAAGKVPVSTALQWAAAAGATSYEVYFGTAPTPALAGKTAATNFIPRTLAANTKYYWRVVAISAQGRKSSATWWFTTQP